MYTCNTLNDLQDNIIPLSNNIENNGNKYCHAFVATLELKVAKS